MTSLCKVPFPIVEAMVLPFLRNQDVISLMKSCTLYRSSNFNPTIVENLSSLYAIGIIYQGKTITKNLFIGHNIADICKHIKTYYINKSNIDFFQSIDFTMYKYHVNKIKFGDIFSIPQEHKTLYNYEEITNSSIQTIYPSLVGSNERIHCSSLKTWDSVKRIMYIFTPNHCKTAGLFADSIKKFGVQQITNQTTKDRVCTRYFFY